MVNLDAVKSTIDTGVKLVTKKSKATSDTVIKKTTYILPTINKLPISSKEFKKLEELLNSIKDETIKDYLITEIISSGKFTSKMMSKFKSFVDSIRQATSKFPIEKGEFKSPEHCEIRNFLEKKGRLNELSEYCMAENIEQEERFFLIKDFITKNPKNKMSNYLYENYYLKYLEQKYQTELESCNKVCLNSGIFASDLNGAKDTIENLREINKVYGIKVFLDENLNEQSLKATNKLKDELSIWKHYGEERAKFPKVLDYNRLKLEFFKDRCLGFASSFDGNIAISSISQPVSTLRHELTHLNEGWLANLIFVFSDMLREGVRLVENSDNFMGRAISKFRNSKVCRKFTHYDELKKAGISDHYISYSKKNHSEAIAVAAQGDMEEYSKLFKFILRLKGLPLFETKFPALEKEHSPFENFAQKIKDALFVNEEGIQVVNANIFE